MAALAVAAAMSLFKAILVEQLMMVTASHELRNQQGQM